MTRPAARPPGAWPPKGIGKEWSFLKVGLLTFYHIHHYGTLLQAAAMAQAVQAQGAGCEIVGYYVNQDNPLFRSPARPAGAAANLHTALHYRRLWKRQKRFEDFAKSFLPVGACRYESFEALQAARLPYELLLCGSDQIWNPAMFPGGRFDPAFFGAFSGLRKAAYAPSFGISPIPGEMEASLREYLAPFSHLSAREPQGRELIRRLTGREAPVVLDPILLTEAERWSAIAAGPKQGLGTYILCYCVSAPGTLTPYIESLAAETGLPVVQLCGRRLPVHPSARLVLDAGPAEFLGWFQNAACVCTNSFYGAAFSVLFHRPFFAGLTPAGLAEPERSQTYGLLSRLGLTERLTGRGNSAGPADPIHWEMVQERLEEARRTSLDYLRAALEDSPCRSGEAAGTAKDAPPVLADRSHCTGCAACKNICPRDAISMERDREGFAYPVIRREICDRCGRCASVCPVLHPRLARKCLPAVFAAWSRDGEIRRESTSGGVFSVLAEDVLEGGGVVYGAALDGRQRLHHIACFRKEDLWRLRGAKYVQSDLGQVFREISRYLESRPVLFSGTPCQVDGLYRYLGGRPENLTTCDLVCQGVPSPGVWEAMTRVIEARKGRSLQTVRFCSKVEGWKNGHFTAVFEDGALDSRPLIQTEYGWALSRGLFLRPSCYRCPYASINRPGDFTLGDFRGLAPGELPEQQIQGVSLLLVNTAHGSHVFDRLPLCRQSFPPERAIAGNPRLVSPVLQPSERAAFFAAFAARPFSEVLRKFCALPPLPVRAASKIFPGVLPLDPASPASRKRFFDKRGKPPKSL